MGTTTTVKERPIVLRSDEVRAILDGRKTQVRRPVKDVEDCSDVVMEIDPDAGPFWRFSLSDGGATQCHDVDCPFGRRGDRLWVRETHRVIEDPAAEDREVRRWEETEDGDTLRWVVDYGVDAPTRIMDKIGKPQWRSPVAMPRWASRITLEITGVRVERLQAISEADVQAEGCTGSPFGASADRMLYPFCWDSMHGKSHPWESDPWVWVVEFRRIAD